MKTTILSLIVGAIIATVAASSSYADSWDNASALVVCERGSVSTDYPWRCRVIRISGEAVKRLENWAVEYRSGSDYYCRSSPLAVLLGPSDNTSQLEGCSSNAVTNRPRYWSATVFGCWNGNCKSFEMDYLPAAGFLEVYLGRRDRGESLPSRGIDAFNPGTLESTFWECRNDLGYVLSNLDYVLTGERIIAEQNIEVDCRQPNTAE